MDDLALDDATVDAQLARSRGPMSRQPYGFGAGDLGKLWFTLGMATAEDTPRWMREECAPMKRMGGHSRFLLYKAGRVRKRKQGEAQLTGVRREAELFMSWLREVESGAPQPLDIDPETMMWAGGLPSEFGPWVDNREPRLVSTTDGWARTESGALVTLSIKCARYGYDRPAWWNGITEPPWYYRLQAQAEMGVLFARHALVIIGCGWNRDDSDPRDDGPIKVLRVDRDDDEIERIRGAVRRGWAEVEKLRAR